MSDTPQGGWWKAKDGKWYPPETHPDRVREAAGSVAAGPPAAGWWQANDGNWYPPETHPELQSVEASAPDPAVAPTDDPFAPLTDDAPPAIDDLPFEHGAPAAAPVAMETPEIVDITEPGAPPLSTPSVEDPPPAATPVMPPPLGADSGAAAAGWGGFGGNSHEEPSSSWGSVDTVDPADDLTVPHPVSEPTPSASAAPAPSASPLFGGDVHDDGAPLPGWRRGSDGAWYPPGVELPAEGSAASEPAAPLFPRATDVDERPQRPAGPVDDDRSSRRPLLIALGAVAAVVVLVVAGIVLFGGDDAADDAAGPSTGDDTATTAPATSAPTTSAAPASTVPPEPPGQVSGTGSAEVSVGRTVTGPLLALATHDGPGGFVVSFVSSDGTKVQQPMAGTDGTYLGVLPVNFVADESFDSVRVDGEGPWAVTFAVVESAPQLPTQPGQIYEGQGDEVLRVGAPADLAVSVGCASCGEPVSVVAFDNDGSAGELLIPRLDVITVPAGTAFLQVTARAPEGAPAPGWTMRVG